MNTNEIAKRNDKSEKLKVFRLQDGHFYVESAEGKICYKVIISNGTKSCSCADYTTRIEKDPTFLCKHALAVINGNGNIRDIDMAKDQTPKLDDRFIIEIKRKDVVKEFVLYAGLLDLGHQKGIRKLSVVAVQYPTKENNMEAICKSFLESKDGDIFEEIGDANPKNVNYMVVEHILRVAATRAKARVLRDYTNIGMTCLEELGNLDDDENINSYPKPKTKGRKEARSETATQPKPEQPKGGPTTDDRKEERRTKDAEAEPKLSDSGAKDPEKKKDTKASDTADKKNPAKPSKAQVEAIEKLRERRGISGEQLVKIFTDKFNKKYEEINADEAKNFINYLQHAA